MTDSTHVFFIQYYIFIFSFPRSSLMIKATRTLPRPSETQGGRGDRREGAFLFCLWKFDITVSRVIAHEDVRKFTRPLSCPRPNPQKPIAVPSSSPRRTSPNHQLSPNPTHSHHCDCDEQVKNPSQSYEVSHPGWPNQPNQHR